jgi:hypothetical protein
MFYEAEWQYLSQHPLFQERAKTLGNSLNDVELLALFGDELLHSVTDLPVPSQSGIGAPTRSVARKAG